MDTKEAVQPKLEYVAPIATVRDIEVQQAFLQSGGSAGGFEDGEW